MLWHLFSFSHIFFLHQELQYWSLQWFLPGVEIPGFDSIQYWQRMGSFLNDSLFLAWSYSCINLIYSSLKKTMLSLTLHNFSLGDLVSEDPLWWTHLSLLLSSWAELHPRLPGPAVFPGNTSYLCCICTQSRTFCYIESESIQKQPSLLSQGGLLPQALDFRFFRMWQRSASHTLENIYIKSSRDSLGFPKWRTVVPPLVMWNFGN